MTSPKPLRFSYEILENIFSNVTDQPSQYNLALTSRLFNQIVSPLLYKTINLSSPYQTAVFQLNAPTWAFDAVHHLELSFTPQRETMTAEQLEKVFTTKGKRPLHFPNLISLHLTYQEQPYQSLLYHPGRKCISTVVRDIISQRILSNDQDESSVKHLKVIYIKDTHHLPARDGFEFASPYADDEEIYLFDLLLELRWKYKSIISVEASVYGLTEWDRGVVGNTTEWRERIMNV
ncbi:hypothetical protein I302_108782 [Kwoniella bestiolae CBS 10118]|uniref:Uncharacterized protein n=1 Tax=Kwoniella bestiolae CBS 10118 TaxID=1296100 RepID=A0A1B9FU26_9TREE|nr:hypothetical protein I302_07919 [Kwoniella bestiolae CBS 10118]OCF22274.1 hypothetical protein I302_07919 [Kwoniella bestiolae CBS 10118]